MQVIDVQFLIIIGIRYKLPIYAMKREKFRADSNSNSGGRVFEILISLLKQPKQRKSFYQRKAWTR